MNLTRITLVSLICAVPLAVFGEPGGNKSGNPRAGGNGERPHARPDGERGGRPNTEWWNEKFREELREFCKTNSPNRWKEIEALPKGQHKEAKIGAMGWQFRGLQMLKEQDKALYDLKVKEIQAQDEEFGILQNPDKLSPDELKSKLRDKAHDYVTLRLDERRHRIDRLLMTLQNEKKDLEKDKDKVGTLVEDRVDMLIKQGPSLFPTPGPRRGGEGARNDSTRPARAATVNSAPTPTSPSAGN
jgi:hypothetical protein